jgi:hypothetical protein
MKKTNKGIFCIEGLWDHKNILDKSTVLPILELLEKRGICNYSYHDCGTSNELEFFLSKWVLKTTSSKLPILYLAFHGEEGCINIGAREKYTIEKLGEILEDKCHGKIIYFGSCSTLSINAKKIKNFLNQTGAIAAIGYKEEIDWIQSTACDLFVFEALQKDKLDTRGITKIYEKIVSDYGNLHIKLGLRVIINDKQHFPRKRK